MTKTKAMEALEYLQTQPPQTQHEIMRGLTMRLTSGQITVARLHYSAHPERDPFSHPEWSQKERLAYSSQAAWDREQEIMDEAGGGELVFADILRKHWNKIVIEDRTWNPDREFRVEGGFDYGKTNPTVLLRAYIDFDGNIVYAGEYYQPHREIWQHATDIKRMEDLRRTTIYADPSMFHRTSQQSQRPGHAPEVARSYADLYRENDIDLYPFEGDLSDISFAGRLMQHWADLEHREPTVKILCPRGSYIDKPVPGLHQWGCPNLLWELMNTRRVKLSAQQLLYRNVSERIVGRDNHARDAMKYHLMSHPVPSQKSFRRRVDETFAAAFAKDPTTAVAQFPKIMQREMEKGVDFDEQTEMGEEIDEPLVESPEVRLRRMILRSRREWKGR